MQLPASLIQSLQGKQGFDATAFEAVHNSAEQVVSVRINKAKIPASHFSSVTQLPLLSPVPWSSMGWYLSERPSFTQDPMFHAGAYYVQEASSMFLEEAMRQSVDLSQPLKVLDLCAAPGGKSTLLQSIISGESLLVSNEVIKTRVNILAENITKWGAVNVIVTNNDPRDFQRLPHYFDVIVVDAPCSGSGLFRKDPDAIAEWSEQNVQLCSERQQRILADIIPALKPGGVLIYSTCSYSEQEDEQVAEWLTRSMHFETIPLRVTEQWGIVETSSASGAAGYRFYPHRIKGEGFYLSAFRKNASAEDLQETRKTKNKTEKLPAAESKIVAPFVDQYQHYCFFKQQDAVMAIPQSLEQSLQDIKNALYIRKAGVELGTIIRTELVPSHELAVSTMAAAQLPYVELDEHQALQYLRRQDITVQAAHKGWSLVRFKQLPLGWIKVLPNRVNNYYPKDWRILNK